MEPFIVLIIIVVFEFVYLLFKLLIFIYLYLIFFDEFILHSIQPVAIFTSLILLIFVIPLIFTHPLMLPLLMIDENLIQTITVIQIISFIAFIGVIISTISHFCIRIFFFIITFSSASLATAIIC